MLPSSVKTDGRIETSLRAVETTPLVTGSGPGDTTYTDSNKYQESSSPAQQDSWLAAVFRPIVWYLGGFPLWVSVASNGKKNLTTHIHELALKSPHPIRIGDVEYTGSNLQELTRIAKGAGNVAILRAFTRSESLPVLVGDIIAPVAHHGQQPMVMARPSGGDLNKRIGQELLEKQKNTKRPEEADPQEAPPTWYDYIVAVFFLLFGGLAFSAGIISLFIQNT